MDFGFGAEELAYQRELRRFARDNLAPHYQSSDRAARMRPELPGEMAAMGLTGLRIPERYGGQEAGAVIAGMAAEEIAAGDFNASYLIINTALIADILVRHAGARQQAEDVGDQ
ncbi:acyl-CoA dehydrogenase family protein, partial [Sciscionella sediminilitoris]|uniref:acyl-CoA dehydrogenase family protein n=1 Tax=Sciscionella sediminilitoris TaxID=1445613 RepID=UPI0004DF779E